MAWYRAALAPDEILYLAPVLALLKKMLRWVDTDERKLRDKLAHVFRVVLYRLGMLQTEFQRTYVVAIDLKVA